MSYCMRFVAADDGQIDMDGIEAALRKADSRYAVGARGKTAGGETGELAYGGRVCARLMLHSSGDGLRHEVEMLHGIASKARSAKRERVLELLGRASQVLSVGAQWEDGDQEETLKRLDPLWSWLAATYDGLVQADGEGFYDGMGLVLKAR